MSGTQIDASELEVLFEDNHLLAVYKPAGVLVQGDRTGDRALVDTARDWLKLHHDKPGNVYLAVLHRLDRPVAGVVLFAKTSKAAARLAAAFRERRVEKVYRAVVSPPPAREQDTLHHTLNRREDERRTEVVPEGYPGAQAAALSYRVLARHGVAALVELQLLTGRAHQIRAQMAAIGAPLLGDTKYGASIALEGRRVALYAASLTVPHPTRGEMVTVRSPEPPGWPWPPPR